MLTWFKQVAAELHQPYPPEPRRHIITLTLLVCAGVAVSRLFGPDTRLSVQITIIALAAAAGVISIWIERVSSERKLARSVIPVAVAGLSCLWIIVWYGGRDNLTLFYTIFVCTVMFTATFPKRLALILALYACALILTPLLAQFDTQYLLHALIAIPILLATHYFVAETLEPMRMRVREHRHLATLAKSTEILVKQNVAEILHETVRQVMETTGSDSCILFLRNSEGNFAPEVISLSPLHYAPEEEALWRQLRVKPGEGMTGWVALQRVPLISGDSDRDPRGRQLHGSAREDASAIFAPMILGQQVTGVIRASRQGLNQFTTEDLQLLQVLAGQAAIAVEQARLYEETRELAMTDPLTGLANRHYFNREVQPQFSSHADGHTVAVMMIDIYEFKLINDAFGHLVGDEILQLTAQILRQSIRRGDMAVRYGGDEFVIVMPDTTLAEAEASAERIEAAVTDWNEAHRRPDGPRLSLNIGVGSALAADLTSLLAKADSSMYAAKRSADRARLTKLVEESAHVRQRHVTQAVMALSKIQQLKDPTTSAHAERARQLAVKVAECFGLSQQEAEKVGLGAVLHDVGKLVVPAEILHKQGSLTREEWAIMRRHPEDGAQIVGQLEVLSELKPLILHHQERFDGETEGKNPGYPQGLKGEQIPIGSRIIAVVDAYDAMTSTRSYRNGSSPEEAVAVLNRLAGTQFDPAVVDTFVAVLREQGEIG